MPSGTNKYVYLCETSILSNGAKMYTYSCKYYNSSGVFDTPTDTSLIKQVIPLYYLKTKNASTAPKAPKKKNIKNGTSANCWTTGFPIAKKPKNSDKYYISYKYICFNNDVKISNTIALYTPEFSLV